ncbi:alpha/beta hydrolase [Candidatus Daviesbacteria bacterium]|nr:alpha/beta hydrolase [Candidatus Daviesbacteria bacterium]
MGNEEKTMGVVILHGWTYSTDLWQPFMNTLREKGFEIKLLKIPGLTEKLETVWDINNYVDWLDQEIGKEKVILLGHSNGGRMALAYTLKYPEKVKNLILIDSAGIYHNDLPVRVKRFVFKTIAKLGRKITASQSLRKLLYKLSRESDYENASPVVKQTMVNLISFDLRNSLNQIKVPTLIIWGKNDKATPLSDGKLMHQLIPDSKMHIIETARHSPQFTHVDEVVKTILKEIT